VPINLYIWASCVGHDYQGQAQHSGTVRSGYFTAEGKTTMLVLFRAGDRIKVRISTPFVQAGTLGTILRVYRSLANAYDIQFDRDSHHWVMQGRDLEPAVEEPLCLPSTIV
jgi:hypothetical protein